MINRLFLNVKKQKQFFLFVIVTEKMIVIILLKITILRMIIG